MAHIRAIDLDGKSLFLDPSKGQVIASRPRYRDGFCWRLTIIEDRCFVQSWFGQPAEHACKQADEMTPEEVAGRIHSWGYEMPVVVVELVNKRHAGEKTPLSTKPQTCGEKEGVCADACADGRKKTSKKNSLPENDDAARLVKFILEAWNDGDPRSRGQIAEGFEPESKVKPSSLLRKIRASQPLNSLLDSADPKKK